MRSSRCPDIPPLATAPADLPACPGCAPVGSEWLVDAEGCRPEALADLRLMQRVCRQIIAQLDLHVLGAGKWHQFPPSGGVTGLFLLTESHLACHTYPESGMATFNLYCCRPRPDWPWEERLGLLLGAVSVTVRCIERGATRSKQEGPSA